MNAQAPAVLSAALKAVESACRVTRSVQQRLESVREITKDDRSPVTVADFAAQAVVAHVLQQELGGNVPIVGEESAGALREPDQQAVREAVIDAVRLVWPDALEDDVLNAIDACNHDASANSYWTLDPVDGTKGFLRNGQYALALGLIEHGTVTAGVMGCPNLSLDLTRDFNDPDPDGVIFSALKGQGANCVPAGNVGQKPQAIRITDTADSDARVRVCESVESGHTKHDDTARIVEFLGGAGAPARLDSQAKYAVVARGQADAYLRMPTRPGYVEKIWDHAAGMLVATEAGAVVSDVEGKPLDFSHGARLVQNRGVICATRQFHSRIIEAIRTLHLAQPVRS